MFAEDGLTTCIDLVDAALRRSTNGHELGDDWLIGTGTASSIHETAPPTEHVSDAWATLRDDGIYEIAVGTVEFGEGTSTAHVQIAASVLGTTPSRIHLVQSDTDRTGFRHRGVRQRGTVRLGQRRAERRDRAARQHPALRRLLTSVSTLTSCSMDDDGVKCGDARLTLDELLEAARGRGIRFTVSRKAYGSPRSVTSNTHGFRIAVHRVTGEIRILYSVHATDAGVVINPAQVRGQIEGGVAQAHRLRPHRELPRRRERRDDRTRTCATTASPPTPTFPAPR